MNFLSKGGEKMESGTSFSLSIFIFEDLSVFPGIAMGHLERVSVCPAAGPLSHIVKAFALHHTDTLYGNPGTAFFFFFFYP